MQRVKNILIQLDSRDSMIARLDGEIVSLKKQNDARVDSVLEDEARRRIFANVDVFHRLSSVDV